MRTISKGVSFLGGQPIGHFRPGFDLVRYIACSGTYRRIITKRFQYRFAEQGIAGMKTIYSAQHSGHFGRSELIDGVFHSSFECPARATQILEMVKSRNVGPVEEPRDSGLSPILRIHGCEYIDFLEGARGRWTAEGNNFDLLSQISPFNAHQGAANSSQNLLAQMGRYSFDMVTPITEANWVAAYSAAQVALTAQEEIRDGAVSAFALCRPPGRHAGADYLAGFCYLNNAAIAAQAFPDNGATRVSILDVDYHHGNGAQDIFYRRDDVQFLSIHGHPSYEYPSTLL